MTDDETDDGTDVRSAEEIARANGVDIEVVREGIEAMAAADEMTECEEAAIEERIGELEDADRRHSTEEVAEELDIDLNGDTYRERFALAVGMVATGWDSLPEAAESHDVDPENVARALSRHQFRADYDGRLWADRRDDEY